jgi:hypothetical protein
MADPLEGLLAELRDLAIAREEFPMWSSWGVEDESSTVHSLGMTYLTMIGQRLGLASCCEYPVDGYRVRADSVWWDKGTHSPVALFEFERFKGGSELEKKAKNLLRAYHALDNRPKLLGLVFWTKAFYPLSHTGLRGLWSIFERGYLDDDRRPIAPAPLSLLRVFEVSHREAGPGRHRLKSINERRRP